MNEYKLNENIKRYRKLLNYTQTEMAKKIGCTTAGYCKYEKGDTDIPSRILIKIADLFHISLDKLTGRGVFAEDKIKSNYIEESFEFINSRKGLKPKADGTLCDDSDVLRYIKLYNDYLDCFSTDTIYNAITYFSDRLSTYKLLNVFHASATGYRKYSKKGNLVKNRNYQLAKDIEFNIDKSPLEITKILKEKYPAISYARVQRIIYEFDIRPKDKEQTVKKGLWLNSFDNLDIYIIVEPESGYVLGLGNTVSEAYSNALDKAVTLMDIKDESGYKTGKSKFFSCLKSEYLEGEKPTRILVARYMYFYNNIRVNVYNEHLKDADIPFKRLTYRK